MKRMSLRTEELLQGILTGLKFCAFLTALLIWIMWLTTGVPPWGR